MKCYGGPMHGKVVSFEGPRFEALMKPRLRQPIWDVEETPVYGMGPPRFLTYMVEKFREQQGTAYQEIQVAVVEGHKNILPHEEWEMAYDLHKLPWSPIRKPSILQEFDSWFNWCAYRHTYKERYLVPEFCKPKLS